MAVQRVKIIINPAAGANSTRRKWPRIKTLFEQAGLTFDHQHTEGTGHAIELAERAAAEGYSCLVSVGGDGTVSEVANGILNSGNGKNTALAVISTGTGSDFARSAGIPQPLVSACFVVAGPGRLLIDVGQVECLNRGRTVKRFFVNGAGIGFDAAVSENTNRLPKKLGGTFPYLTGLFLTMVRYRNKQVEMRIGDRAETARVLSVVVANGRYFGGGMKVAPDARLDDSLLDVVVLGDVSKFDLIKSLPMIYKGTHGRHPKVSMEQATTVTVESPERVLVHADGELIGEGPAAFGIKPGALSIVV